MTAIVAGVIIFLIVSALWAPPDDQGGVQVPGPVVKQLRDGLAGFLVLLLLVRLAGWAARPLLAPLVILLIVVALVGWSVRGRRRD